MVKEPGSLCPAPEVHLLGEVVVAFGTLEFGLEVSIWQLLNLPPGSIMALTANMSFKQKLDAFASMFRGKKIVDSGSKLKELCVALRKAEDRRNQLMHSTWNYTDIWGGSSFMRMKASSIKATDKHDPHHRFFRMSVREIKESLDSIHAANELLARFTMEYIQDKSQPGYRALAQGVDDK